MKPSFFFDYIFYCVSEFYLKANSKESFTKGIISVTWIQTLAGGGVLSFLARLFYDRDQTLPYAKTIAAAWVIAAFIVYVFNHYKFTEERYNVLKEFWKDEPLAKRKLKDFFVLMSIILSMLPLILIGVYW
jgi:hypothetical protein